MGVIMNGTSSNSRRLIVCCDGTWNRPESDSGDANTPATCTNVLKTVRAIKSLDQVGTDQIVYYERGVGTSGMIDRFVAGATGYGIKRNIEQAYRFLANNYAPGDELWCFGFSRGAYTVRSLMGLVNTIGLISPSGLRYFSDIYEYYRKTGKKHELVSKLRMDEESLKTKEGSTPTFKFCGVWDTVGALGAPTPMLRIITRKFFVGFHDTTCRRI